MPPAGVEPPSSSRMQEVSYDEGDLPLIHGGVVILGIWVVVLHIAAGVQHPDPLYTDHTITQNHCTPMSVPIPAVTPLPRKKNLVDMHAAGGSRTHFFLPL
ncbi:hypothetical protein DFH09DRAFT_1103922 [Mycena vulgaris]|nr:hypothetical protein DFH09DRAFT_1103922 [Mycena vulgaris]